MRKERNYKEPDASYAQNDVRISCVKGRSNFEEYLKIRYTGLPVSPHFIVCLLYHRVDRDYLSNWAFCRSRPQGLINNTFFTMSNSDMIRKGWSFLNTLHFNVVLLREKRCFWRGRNTFSVVPWLTYRGKKTANSLYIHALSITWSSLRLTVISFYCSTWCPHASRPNARTNGNRNPHPLGRLRFGRDQIGAARLRFEEKLF